MRASKALSGRCGFRRLAASDRQFFVDFTVNVHSSIFDALSTKSQEDGYARVVSWYDNEWGYSNRVVDLIEMLAAVS